MFFFFFFFLTCVLTYDSDHPEVALCGQQHVKSNYSTPKNKNKQQQNKRKQQQNKKKTIMTESIIKQDPNTEKS